MKLAQQHCTTYEKGSPSLPDVTIKELMHQISGWEINSPLTQIKKTIHCKNYYETIACVNAIAWMAHQENHHPDMQVSFNKIIIEYTTHDVNGLSGNDFICAAKVDNILGN